MIKIERIPEFFTDRGAPNHYEIAQAILRSNQIKYSPSGVLAAYDHGVYKEDEYAIQRIVNDILLTKAAPSHTNRVAHICEPKLEKLTHDQPPPYRINIENGIYNYKTNILEPHHPAHNSFVQLPIYFDDSAECPFFNDFLNKIVPQKHKEENTHLIWEVIAYCLMHGNPLQIAILFYGPGSNGKSTLMNVIQSLIGRNNCSNITLNQMSKTFEPAELLGKQLNLVGDLDVHYLQETETFKKITGGDPITAQRKNRDPFTFVNWAVPLFASNSLWKSRDLSEGYFRRWLIIPLLNRITSNDFNYNAEMLMSSDERSGIFNKAIPYLMPLLERGHFIETPETLAIKNQFKVESDTVATWLDDDELILTNSPIIHPEDSIYVEDYFSKTPYTRRSYVHRRFTAWCLENGFKPSSSQVLYKRLETLNYPTTKKKEGHRVVFGLTFKEYNK